VRPMHPLKKIIDHLNRVHLNMPSPETPEFAELVKRIIRSDWGIRTSDDLDRLIAVLSQLRDAVVEEEERVEAAE
jgi:hypothetical protein